MTSSTALLVAATEPETGRFLARRLPLDGFELVGAQGCPDLVLAGDPAAVEQWVEHAAVIVIGGAEADRFDRSRAFRSGCDDYVASPLDYDELLERIHAVLRRVRPPAPAVVHAPPIRIDTETRDVRVHGRRVQLSQKEYELLLRLAREPQRVLTKSELLRDIWRYQVPGRTRTLDSHASRLRRKLREAGAARSLIDNVWGVGYRFVGPLHEE